MTLMRICSIYSHVKMSPLQFLVFALATSTVYALALPILPPTHVLRLDAKASFQLSIFSDLHYGEAEDTLWGPQQDAKSARVLNSVLDAENTTGLVVLNGDLVTGENTYLHNSSRYLDAVVAPLVQRGISWASTYGNHDSDFNLSRESLLAEESKYPLSRTQNMVSAPDAGVSNYYIPIYGDNSSMPEFLLWFFDSRGGNYFQQKSARGNSVPQPNWVSQSVVDWFVKTRTEFETKYARAIPSIAFVHTPVNAMRAFQSTGVDAHRDPGINDDDPLSQQGSAQGQGDVSGTVSSYSGQDIPFMQALLDTKSLKAVFSGHDHGDDWCFKWNGTLSGMNLTGNCIDLCFGRHSGYGGYGSWTRGSRQVLLQKGKDEIETWIRLEDGSISGKVMLNSTYGQDRYLAVQG